MRKAVIDLGTNTFNLLIAEVTASSYKILHAEKEGVALGMNGINKKMIAADAMERALKSLRHYKAECEKFEVVQIMAFGTSALRDATNQKEFIDLMDRELGLHIEVISGLEEAELIFKGVNTILDITEEAVIMDIGGGSTEFILAANNHLVKSVSLNIGVSRIYQQFQFQDPISLEDERKVINFLDQKTDEFLKDWHCPVLIGSSGSFETFYELIYNQKFPKENKIIEIELSELTKVLQELKKSTIEERDKNDFILPIRKIMAPITAIKVEWLIKKMGVKKVLISPYSLKEGALFKDFY